MSWLNMTGVKLCKHKEGSDSWMLMLRYEWFCNSVPNRCKRFQKYCFEQKTKLALLFVVSESNVLPSLVPFFYFSFFYPIEIQGLHCHFSSLLQVLGAERGGVSHCPAAGTLDWMMWAIFFRLRQVRCSLQGQELSEVLIPHQHPLVLPPDLSKHKASNFQGVPCRLTGINVTLSFDHWQSHSQRIFWSLSCIPSSLYPCLFHTSDTHFIRLKSF